MYFLQIIRTWISFVEEEGNTLQGQAKNPAFSSEIKCFEHCDQSATSSGSQQISWLKCSHLWHIFSHVQSSSAALSPTADSGTVVARRRKSDVQREHWGLWPPTEGSELLWECKEDDATSAVIIGVKYLPIKCKEL